MSNNRTLAEEIEYLQKNEFYRNTIERSSLINWHADHAYAIKALTAERNALQARVAELERDAGRLDWLDMKCSTENGQRIACLPGGLRAAIDAAREVKP